jgi:acetyl-CoA acetyltransferase
MTIGQRVAIVGLGYSQVGRKSGLSMDQHVIQATKAALADSGLTVNDIDGIACVGSEPLNDAWLLGIEPLNWFASGMMAPAFSFAAMQSIAAIASGFCHTALALRVIMQQPSGAALAKGDTNHPMTAVM